MGLPHDWSGVAFNQATSSENRIHADDVALRYGFRGGLVPGVTVHAYLTQPAIEAWGLTWLATGGAKIVLRAPLYDGETFDVELTRQSERRFEARLFGADRTLRADAEVWCGGSPPGEFAVHPKTAPAWGERPEATRDTLERLREEGLGSLHMRWDDEAELTHSSRDLDDVPDLVRLDRGGYAGPGFTLGLANWILARNVRLGPWIHVQSEVQHLAAVARHTQVRVEARVADLFERKGNQFVDLDVAAFRDGEGDGRADGEPLLAARHRAIYVLRERSPG